MKLNNAKTIIVRADRIIDGIGAEPLTGMVLVIEDGLIKSILRDSHVSKDEDGSIRYLEYPGSTILPGLIDCHTHTNMPGNGRKGEEVNVEDDDETRIARALRNVRVALENGVTTLCDNGAWNDLGFRLKNAIKDEIVLGPKVLVCGNPITIKRGHCWFMGSEVEGIAGVRKKARSHLSMGADFLKTMTTGGSTIGTQPYNPAFTSDELSIITEEANAAGVFTVAHARCTAGISMAVEAGFSMIAHCVFARADETYYFDETVASRLVEREVWINPTLAIWQSRLHLLKEKAKNQELSEEEQQDLAKGEKGTAERIAECQQLKNLGAKFVAGSDCGWGVYPFGYFSREIEALGSVGLSPMESIIAGTSDAARAIKLFDTVGSLEPGKKADLLVVEGDPIKDLSRLSEVVAVFKDGQLVERRLCS